MHCKLFSIARTVLTGGCIRNRLSTNGNEDMSLHVNLNANLITVASNALGAPLNGERPQPSPPWRVALLCTNVLMYTNLL